MSKYFTWEVIRDLNTISGWDSSLHARQFIKHENIERKKQTENFEHFYDQFSMSKFFEFF